MKLKRPGGGFWLCFFLNMIFNLEWSIPAWICLALYFAIDISIWWFVGALSLWLGGLLLTVIVLQWVSDCSDVPPRRKPENKNPYSVKTRNPYENMNKDNK